MHSLHTRRALACLMGFAFVIAPPAAEAGLEDTFFFGAFGGWAYKETDGLHYLNADNEGTYDSVSGGITFGAIPVPKLKIQGQIFAHAGGDGGIDLDWILAEWTFNKRLKLRAGQIKQPVGLYSETFEIGVARPFFNLPQSAYGPSGIQGEAYLGGGITGELYSDENWYLSYDLYAGQVELEITEPWELIEEEEHQEEEIEECIDDGHDPLLCLIAGGAGGEDDDHEELDVTAAVGGRLSLETPIEGLSVAASGFGGDTNQGSTWTIGLQAQYQLDWANIQAEFFHTERKGDIDIDFDAFYVEASYRPFLHLDVGPGWLGGVELAGRYDWLDGTPAEHIDSRYTTHKEGSAGLNYWFSPGFVAKLSYHHVSGNMFAFDIGQQVDGTLKRNANVVMVGVHFAFF